MNWTAPAQVAEGLSLMNRWSPIEPVDALGLLSLKFPDPAVRSYAVSCLDNISTEELQDYIPQLVQVLKKEHFHVNAISKFLLRKAMSNVRIAYELFWYLKVTHVFC
jgi:phosphatidylinositol-4,5-bisphosphate 3-kinase